MKIKLVIICCVFLTVSQRVYSWGKDGHRIVANGAFKMLSPEKQKKLMAIITNAKADLSATNKGQKSIEDPKTIDAGCTWLDDIRHYYPKFTGMENWHFYNDDKVLPNDNVVDAINNCILKIETGKLSPSDLKENYLIILHLLGDIMQPLHCGYANDRGGNEYPVSCKACKVNDKSGNSDLHHVWDDEIIWNNNISIQSIASLVKTDFQKEKSLHLKDSPKGQLKKVVMEWRNETFAYVKGKKNYPHPAVVDAVYLKKYKSTVELQLAKATVRLAIILDTLLK